MMSFVRSIVGRTSGRELEENISRPIAQELISYCSNQK